MLIISFNERKNTLIKVIKKITKIDKIRGSYLARHILINDINKTIEYTGNNAVLKRTLNLIKYNENK